MRGMSCFIPWTGPGLVILVSFTHSHAHPHTQENILFIFVVSRSLARGEKRKFLFAHFLCHSFANPSGTPSFARDSSAVPPLFS